MPRKRNTIRKPRRKRRKTARAFEPMLELSPGALKGIVVVFCFALALISLLSIFGIAGSLGEFLYKAISVVFGWGSFLVPLFLIILGIILINPEKFRGKPATYVGIVLFIVSLCGVFHLHYDLNQSYTRAEMGQGGGYIGYIVSFLLIKIMGFWAALIVLIALLAISIIMALDLSPRKVLERIKAMREAYRESKLENKIKLFSSRIKSKENIKAKEPEITGIEESPKKSVIGEWKKKSLNFIRKKEEPEVKIKEEPEEDFGFKIEKVAEDKNWKLPSLDLLNGKSAQPTSGDIKANIKIIQKTLEDFGIPVTMGDVSVGPTFTQYTLKPTEGIKLSQITALQNDLALALAAHPIRMEAPIPGKSLVGIEVPNVSVALVRLKEILDSPEFERRKSNLTIALGRDVAGIPQIADLRKMPHLLIAGATGSGKTVSINSSIASLLYQNSPSILKLILIDPKRVELIKFNGIPHLLTPVVTDLNKTINSLKWGISEMDRRYKLFQETEKRDIASYNKSFKEKLPYIVIIVDELADLMAASAHEVESAVIRLAQMARATGIHLLLSTQRPSVDVITGLIKANITSRIAFKVASQVDSRTIIDNAGADKLVGNGDMLFMASELGKPKRIQGAYISEKEIEKLVDYLKQKKEPEYDEKVVEKQAQAQGGVPSDEEIDDELFEEAKKTVIQMGKGSASLLQRRLRIGYARAARLLDLLEERGIVGPPDGAKPRDVLVGMEKDGGFKDEKSEDFDEKNF